MEGEGGGRARNEQSVAIINIEDSSGTWQEATDITEGTVKTSEITITRRNLVEWFFRAPLKN
ncbi:hypothetical protein WN55_06688 [Dufourea novaeangliae]|uniref:Uncharacterized protein n=1 Tax=Dufourea novaeangliae TaxID=178035 RepID=A0A154PQN8_DUFNO|nr:hypothetical protein WN55_06688 [Dufourea novaeangliae]